MKTKKMFKIEKNAMKAIVAGTAMTLATVLCPIIILADELPAEMSAPVEVAAPAPVEEVPEEVAAPAPVEEVPEEVAAPAPAEVPTEVVAPAPVEEVPEEVAAPAPVEEVPEEVAAPAPVEEYPEETAAPGEEYPEEVAAPGEEYPDEAFPNGDEFREGEFYSEGEQWDDLDGNEKEKSDFEKEAEQYGEEFFRGHYEGEEDTDPNGEYDDPLGRKAQLESLPASPNGFVSGDDLLDYYRLTKKEVGIYDLKPGKVYYMSYHPMNFSAFVQNDYFVVIDKVWEQERGGLFKLFGNFTKRTIQYTDMITGEVCYSRALTSDLRFFELEKIQNVTDPSLRNQFS